MIIILCKKWTCATWRSLCFLDIFIRACTWPPPLPPVESSYSFDKQMLHCIRWMQSTAWVLSEIALAGLQFVMLAWHEAGEIPAADSPFLFFPLCPNNTSSLWLSFDFAQCLRCRTHSRPTHAGILHISNHSSALLQSTASKVCMSSGRKNCQYTRM